MANQWELESLALLYLYFIDLFTKNCQLRPIGIHKEKTWKRGCLKQVKKPILRQPHSFAVRLLRKYVRKLS